MQIPVMRGLIERRILANYRVDPDVLAKLLPAPFRPQVVSGFGIAGICLIRLGQVRPKSLPGWIGLSSENAAHRVAVVWDDQGTPGEGVYIWRRDTDSRMTACVGGRLFPGVHHHASFRVRDSAERVEVALQSDDEATCVSVRGWSTDRWPNDSMFESLDECSGFFEAGSLGYSSGREPSQYQGLELRCRNWQAQPLAVDEVRSSFFDDEALFPRGSAEFDSALIMRNIEHEWHGRADLCCEAPGQI